MGLFSGFMRSSAKTFFMPASRASFDGHTIHEKQQSRPFRDFAGPRSRRNDLGR
jgi:hypothetical protein